jgi:biopolymer transport protein ExbB/TolQ
MENIVNPDENIERTSDDKMNQNPKSDLANTSDNNPQFHNNQENDLITEAETQNVDDEPVSAGSRTMENIHRDDVRKLVNSSEQEIESSNNLNTVSDNDAELSHSETESTVTSVNKNTKLMFLVKLVPAVASISISISIYYYLIPAILVDSFFYRLFYPDGSVDSTFLVPMIILIFFIWTITEMFLISMNIHKQNQQLVNNQVLLDSDFMDTECIANLEQKWNGPKHSSFFKTIKSLADAVQNATSHQSLYDLFRYQTELVSEKHSSRYTFSKIAIWAMPILGFIGTVIGISLAVGNFSGFLVQDIENIDVVKTELSKITTGLSFAFDTTLFGLGSSLLAMLMMTFTQNYENKFLTRVEEIGLNIIENVKFQDQRKVDNNFVGDLNQGLFDKLNELIEDKLSFVSQELSSIIYKFESETQKIAIEFSKFPYQIDSTTSKLVMELIEALEHIEVHTMKALSNMDVKTNEIAERINILFKSLDSNFESLLDAMDRTTIKIAERFDLIPNKIENSVMALVSNYEVTTNRLSNELLKIPEVLEGSNENYLKSLALITLHLDEMQLKFNEMTKKSENIYSGDLPSVLNDMKVTLESLLPVLETLSKPTEIIVTTKK